ncbi:ImmA/IrrE family metallo-endopeptidase [Aestuariivirga sp.]|uniref:ImmA/IrrE family metallo-endopeptidase n=1 Tax=Aestuariivirga sp. TaxID=2650926 RepID=UPI0039E4D33E
MASLAASLSKLVRDYDWLAKRTGIGVERLKALGEGAEPKISEAKAIASVLKLSLPALLDAGKMSLQAEIRYRGARFLPTAAAEARILSIVELFRRHEGLLPNTRSLPVFSEPRTLLDLEIVSQSVREKIVPQKDYQGDPLPDLVSRLDEAKLVHVVRLKNLAIHGAALKLGNSPIIFVASQYLPRSLFSVAHELGHLIFGHVEAERPILDADTVGSFGNSKEESACDSFASALLIPATTLSIFLRTLRSQLGSQNDTIGSTEVLYVSHFFATSFLVAAFRFEQLDILPRGSAIALDRQIKEDHGSAEAFSQKVVLPPRQPIDLPVISSSLRKSMRAAVEGGDLSIGYLADAFGLSTYEMRGALA